VLLIAIRGRVVFVFVNHHSDARALQRIDMITNGQRSLFQIRHCRSFSSAVKKSPRSATPDWIPYLPGCPDLPVSAVATQAATPWAVTRRCFNRPAFGHLRIDLGRSRSIKTQAEETAPMVAVLNPRW
jgi:hypothetical protein